MVIGGGNASFVCGMAKYELSDMWGDAELAEPASDGSPNIVQAPLTKLVTGYGNAPIYDHLFPTPPAEGAAGRTEQKIPAGFARTLPQYLDRLRRQCKLQLSTDLVR